MASTALNNIYGYPILSSGGSDTSGSTFVVITQSDPNFPNGKVITAGANMVVTVSGNAVVLTAVVAGSAGGTVTNFLANNITNFATANVATPTSTPTLTYTLTNQACSTSFMGPVAGAPGTPAFRLIQGQDIGTIFLPGQNVTILESGSSITISAALSTPNFINVSTDVTLNSSTPQFVYVDASLGIRTITLPSAGGSPQVLTIKKVDNSSNFVNIIRAGSDTIDGGASYSLQIPMMAATISNNSVSSWWLS